MSVRQGNSVIAGGIQIDNTPTSGSTNAVSSGGVYAALGGKANIDASNFDTTGKNTVVGWGLPDYSSGVDVSSGYTATAKCWLNAYAEANGGKNTPGAAYVYVNGAEVVNTYVTQWSYTERDRNMVPLEVGDVVTSSSSAGATHMTIYPMKGV